MLDSNWQDHGTFYKPNSTLAWSRTHAMIPTPFRMENNWRIYYSGRNNNNQSSIGCFDLNIENGASVISSESKPILTPGKLGCFDDNGVSPSCVIKLRSGEIALYYIGWNPGSTTRVNLFGGLAISSDAGMNFTRWSEAPILGRTKIDPYINTAPWVVDLGDHYRMYYVSGVGWKDGASPSYNIKIAFSADGYIWERNGQIAIDFKDLDETALARPYVIFHDGIWKMWFSKRSGEYSIGYAESFDGLEWIRKDNEFGLLPNGNGNQKLMSEYGIVLPERDRFWMLFNGDNYGYSGIEIASRML